MKKDKRIINSIFAFILGLLIAGGTVSAISLINSSDVGFTSTKGLRSNNVQAAIDEVYADVVDYNGVKSKTDNIKYYHEKIGVEYDDSGGSTDFQTGDAYFVSNCGYTTVYVNVPFDKNRTRSDNSSIVLRMYPKQFNNDEAVRFGSDSNESGMSVEFDTVLTTSNNGVSGDIKTNIWISQSKHNIYDEHYDYMSIVLTNFRFPPNSGNGVTTDSNINNVIPYIKDSLHFKVGYENNTGFGSCNFQ